MNDNSGSVL